MSFYAVTPCVGVWIETLRSSSLTCTSSVTPCVGVWIETKKTIGEQMVFRVTPCVGVWIETLLCNFSASECSHTLRGCVD